MLPHIISFIAFLLIVAVVVLNNVSINTGRVKAHASFKAYLKFFGTFAAIILVPAVIVIGLFGGDYDASVVFGRIALGYLLALVVGIVINGFDEGFLKATEKYVSWLR